MFNAKAENRQATVTRFITNLVTCLSFKLFRNCDQTLLFQKEITCELYTIDVITTYYDWLDGIYLMNFNCSLEVNWFSFYLAKLQFQIVVQIVGLFLWYKIIVCNILITTIQIKVVHMLRNSFFCSWFRNN